MRYAWPLPHLDPVLDDALDIAMDYLEATGQATTNDSTQCLVAQAILDDWLRGARHQVRLANTGIVAVQHVKVQKAIKNEIGTLFSVFPRVSLWMVT